MSYIFSQSSSFWFAEVKALSFLFFSFCKIQNTNLALWAVAEERVSYNSGTFLFMTKKGLNKVNVF